jgi:hypothetical protein
MKKINFGLILLFATVCVAYAQTNVASLGSAITAAEGMAWIANYHSKFESDQSITLTKNALSGLTGLSDVEGIYILRGLDNSNNETLMFRPADKNGVINHEVILGSDGSAINEEIAHQLFDNFQQKYKDRTPGYLYGKKGFETILNQSNTEGIRFINGIDELNIEHLIFVGVDKKGSEQWTASIWNHGSGIFSFFGWGLVSKK